MSIVIHTINGLKYAYNHFRKGKKVITKYLYPVGPKGNKRPLRQEHNRAGDNDPMQQDQRYTSWSRKSKQQTPTDNQENDKHLSGAGNKCFRCGSTDKSLMQHHTSYYPEKKEWCCRECHKSNEVKKQHRELKQDNKRFYKEHPINNNPESVS